MYGAIIGDIVGSRFEWNNIKTKNFEFFTDQCVYTDDSVLTIAVFDALQLCEGRYENLSEIVIERFRYYGRRYRNCGYGTSFHKWIWSDEPTPYGSWGNGAAMRVSPCAWFGRSLEEVKDLAYKVTCVSHNHPEGLKGAEATAVAVYLARTGRTKAEIRQAMADYYQIDFTLDDIRPTYRFEGSCQGTVPYALEAFFESTSFEDAIRNAISIGGDSDTLGAITGSIAEAFYGIPNEMIEAANRYLGFKETVKYPS